MYAFLACGAIIGFIFMSGAISATPSFEARKPITLGLQWAGLALAGSSVIAGQISSAVLVLAGAALGYALWRSRAALLVGASVGAMLAAVDGADMAILGTPFARFTNRDALVISVIAIAAGIVFAPHRQMITPISKYRQALRTSVAEMRSSGVQLDLASINRRVVALRATTASVKAAAATKATSSTKAAKPKSKVGAARSAKPAKPKGVAADVEIIDRIKAFEGSPEVADSSELSLDEGAGAGDIEEAIPATKPAEISNDELDELIAELETRLRED
jgi:hypothetical protein